MTKPIATRKQRVNRDFETFKQYLVRQEQARKLSTEDVKESILALMFSALVIVIIIPITFVGFNQNPKSNKIFFSECSKNVLGCISYSNTVLLSKILFFDTSTIKYKSGEIFEEEISINSEKEK